MLQAKNIESIIQDKIVYIEQHMFEHEGEWPLFNETVHLDLFDIKMMCHNTFQYDSYMEKYLRILVQKKYEHGWVGDN